MDVNFSPGLIKIEQKAEKIEQKVEKVERDQKAMMKILVELKEMFGKAIKPSPELRENGDGILKRKVRKPKRTKGDGSKLSQRNVLKLFNDEVERLKKEGVAAWASSLKQLEKDTIRDAQDDTKCLLDRDFPGLRRSMRFRKAKAAYGKRLQCLVDEVESLHPVLLQSAASWVCYGMIGNVLENAASHRKKEGRKQVSDTTERERGNLSDGSSSTDGGQIVEP